MLIDRYPPEDVFVRVPELADQTDPVLVQLDQLLEDDLLSQQVRADLARRYRLTPVHGRHSTPVEVLLRVLVVQHLYAWSYAETVARVADSLVLRWFCRVYFQPGVFPAHAREDHAAPLGTDPPTGNAAGAGGPRRPPGPAGPGDSGA